MGHLKKVLNLWTIVFITINSIIGTGIFFLPAIGAKYAGPSSLISWVIIMFVIFCVVMVLAELVSMFPNVGGVYEYTKQAFGKFAGFLVGWLTWIISNVTIAMLIVGAIQYLLPYPLTMVKIIISIILVLVFNFIAYRGMKTSAVMLVTFAIITLISIIILIVPGISTISLSMLKPFFAGPPHNILIAAFFIFETFVGWESITFLAEETKNAKKVIPKGMISAAAIIMGLGLLLVFVSLTNIPWQIFAVSKVPMSLLANLFFGKAGGDFITLLIYVVIIGAAAGFIVSTPRLLVALSRDKLFLKQMQMIHPRYKSPYKAIIFQTIVTIILIAIAFGSYKLLLSIVIPLTIILYMVISATLIRLRKLYKKRKRYFKTPFGVVGSWITIIISIILLVFWIRFIPDAWFIFKFGLSLIVLGIPIFILIELYYDPKLITSVNDIFSYFVLWFEKINLPHKVRRMVLNLGGNLKNKKVLELGCSVGTLTLSLAKAVKPKGKVYAIDTSLNKLKITQKRMDFWGHKHVKLFHHNIEKTIHPKIPNVDAVFSVGIIGYLQYIKDVLKDVNKRLKIGSKIVFLDYDRFFYIIPNAPWLRKDSIVKRIFNSAGFSVDIDRKNGLLWQYIFIHGKKVRDL